VLALLLLLIGIALFVFGHLLKRDESSICGNRVVLVGYVLWCLSFVVWLKS
jgi:hypothetical protein